MAIVSSDFLDGVRTTYQAMFEQITSSQFVMWRKAAIPIDAGNKDTVTLNWLGAPPQLRVFKDELEFGKSFPHDYTIIVDEHGVGIEVKERDFRHDYLGQITNHVQNMMVQAAKYYDKLVFTAIGAGASTTGYDGATFLATSHAAIGDSGTFANYLTGASTTIEADDASGRVEVAWATVSSNKDDSGEPMGLIPTGLLHHPKYAIKARRLLNISTTTGGGENAYTGLVEPVSTPFMTTDTAWAVVAVTPAMAPAAVVEDLPLRFVSQDALNSDGAFMKKVFRFKVECEAKAALGEPRSIYYCKGAA